MSQTWVHRELYLIRKVLCLGLGSEFLTLLSVPFGLPNIFHHNEIYIFGLFRATPVAYGGSQARGQIRTAAAGLGQSHSHVGSKPRLPPTPQRTATLNS